MRGLLRARLPQRQLHAVRCAATSYFERDKTVLDPKDLGFRRDLHQVYNVPDPSMTVPLGTGSYGVVNKVRALIIRNGQRPGFEHAAEGGPRLVAKQMSSQRLDGSRLCAFSIHA